MARDSDPASADVDADSGSDAEDAGVLGAGIERREDRPLIAGRAEYVDDVRAADAAHLALHRSRHAHARVEAIDVGPAERREGVLATYTLADLRDAGVDAVMPTDDPDRGVAPDYPALADRRVRYQGQPIAAVVATDRRAARDAAAASEVEYDRLEAVADPAAALEPASPTIHEAAEDNVAFQWETGDADATAAAFERADRVVDLEAVNNRLVPLAMEPQAAIARYDARRDELRVTASTQKPHGTKRTIADALDLPERRVHVRVPDVGGGFGGKLRTYPGHVLAGWAAMDLDRPVKWRMARSEDLQATVHSRHQLVEAAAALRNGELAGLRATIRADVGGYMVPGGSGVPTNAGKMLPGQYAVEAAHVQITGAFTTTTPMAAYRGAGRPEAAYVIERLAHLAARALDRDPAVFRRENFVPPEAFPHETPTGYTYDSGDYERTLDRALEVADYDRLRERQQELREEGRYLGIGLSCYVDKGGGHVGDFEGGLLRMTRSGTVVAHTGTMDTGQGHRTAYAQIVADELGVPHEDVEVAEGDTERTPEGRGTGGSRSLSMAGNALRASARKLIEQARRVAARELEVAAEDLSFEDGAFEVVGAPERSIRLRELASAAYAGSDALGEVEPGLEETAFFSPTGRTFPFGTHLAVVEVDPDGGEVDLRRYVAVDDCGVRINPTLVEGQVVGGVVQGIGQALYEGVEYDENANLVTGSLQDYAVPRTIHLPEIETAATVTPSPNNPLGTKGVGEVGTTAAPPAIVNAAADALAPFGVEHLDMPLTAETVWRAVRDDD